jgi:hypothetical protein
MSLARGKNDEKLKRRMNYVFLFTKHTHAHCTPMSYAPVRFTEKPWLKVLFADLL